MKQWHLLVEKFTQMTLREKVIVAAAGPVVILMIANMWLFETDAAKLKSVTNQLNQQQKNLQRLDALIEQQQMKLADRPDDKLKRDIAQLQNDLSQGQQALNDAATLLIQPEQMVPVLYDVLKKTGKLKLVRLESQTPKIIMMADSEKADQSTDAEDTSQQQQPGEGLALYEHGLVLELEGGYFAARKFVKNLELLPWRFRWQQIHYEVSQYPDARVMLRLYTLSTSREFIRV